MKRPGSRTRRSGPHIQSHAVDEASAYAQWDASQVNEEFKARAGMGACQNHPPDAGWRNAGEAICAAPTDGEQP
jgi:hypothetical protein